jgi:hypothetical protein
MQAQYTDVLLIVSPPSLSSLPPSSFETPTKNKWEHISERALDDVLEHLNTLNDHTPKIRCAGKSVDPALIFGIDSKLFRDALPLSERPSAIGPAEDNDDVVVVPQHHEEVETITVLRGALAPTPAPAHVHAHTHPHLHTTATSCDHPHTHPHPEEPNAAHASPPPALLDEPTLSAALDQLPKESVYRVKGFIRFASTPAAAEEGKKSQRQWWILNWAFGRWELVPAPDSPSAPTAANEDEDEDWRGVVRLTVMGERGEVRRYARRLAERLGAAVVA